MYSEILVYQTRLICSRNTEERAMGAFIVPRAQKKLHVPTITIEEIVNVLALYVSTFAEYVHSTVDVECDRTADLTRLTLHGLVDPRLKRKARVRATIHGRLAESLNTKFWADPFA